MKRERKSYNIIKSLRNNSLSHFCIKDSNPVVITTEFLDHYTEDEVKSYFEITKKLWIKISHIKAKSTVENVISLDDESFDKRVKLQYISGRCRNRLKIKTNNSHGMEYYL